MADRLGQTFGAQAVRVRSVPARPHHVELWLLTTDPLTQLVEPLPADPDPLTAGLPVAVAEDGTVWRLQLVGSHVLVVGATGAGKGSVIWSLLLQLAPLVRAGLVEVWAVDPKGGMELAAGRSAVRPVRPRRLRHRRRLRGHVRRGPRGRRRGDAPPAGPAPRRHPPPHARRRRSRWSCWSSTSSPR